MIYTFWEGRMPAYIQMCMNTWRQPYTILNFQNVNKYTDLPVSKLKRYSMMLAADIVRVHVLRDNGGIWMDADTIQISDKLPEENIIGDPIERTNTIGFLRTEPRTDMYIEWAKFQDSKMDDPNAYLWWAMFGNAFTNNYVKQHKEITIHPATDFWPEVTMIDNDTTRFDKYLTFYFGKKYHFQNVEDRDMLMLHNSWTPQWYKEITVRDIMMDDHTMSNILNEIR